MKKIVIQLLIYVALFICIAVGLIKLNEYNKGLESEKVNTGKYVSSTDFVMDTVVSQTIYGKDGDSVVADNIECLQMLENDKLSWRKKTSDISKINRLAKAGELYLVAGDTRRYIEDTLKLAKATGGAIDPTIYPLSTLWNIEGDNPKVPGSDDIEAKLKIVNYKKTQVTDNGVKKLKKGIKLDLGSVGKGIGCDEVYKILESYDIDGAVVAVGGSIVTYGSKDNGEKWKVAIRDPKGGDDSVLGVISFSGDNFISTSGDYEKYFIEDGVRYHHILDSKTGYPCNTGISSVTIVCDNGLVSDGLSTACMVLGYEKSLPVLEEYNAEAIFVTKENKIIVTDGLKGCFNIETEGYELDE